MDGSPVVVGIQGPGALEVHWTVYTTAFRKVREGSDSFIGSGSVSWDLKDKTGVSVARGLYYLKVEIHSSNETVRKTLKVLVLN